MEGNEQVRKLPKSFGFFNATQFLGALNDNLFKLLVIYYLIGLQGADAKIRIVATVGVVFVIPFLLFNAASGVLADRVSKRIIIVAMKVAELFIMLSGCLAFWTNSIWLPYSVFFMMGLQSAVFGPAKYGIVPELVGTRLLTRANGVLSACTYLAVIIGTAVAPAISLASRGNFVMAGFWCAVISAAGLVTSLFIPSTPPAGSTKLPSLLFVRDIWRTLVGIRQDRYLLLAVIAGAYFVLLGAFFQLNLIPYGMDTLGLSEEISTYLFLILALGIGAGSILASRMSSRNIEFGLVPTGALLLTITSALFFLVPRHAAVLFMVYDQQVTSAMAVSAVLLLLAGIGGGLFIVPVNTFIQYRSPGKERGEILAASSFLSWIGALIAALAIYLFSGLLNMTPGQGFLIAGLLTLVLTVITLKVLPDFLLRFVFMILARIFYTIRVLGIEHVPVEGPALLVCNHVGWTDAVLLTATQQRRIRFMMSRKTYENSRFARFLADIGQAILIHSTDPPKKIIQAFHEARAALDDGYMVCIFPEGALTLSGQMYMFKSGFERIVKGTGYPIIPVYLGGAWGSIFSYFNGRPLTNLPRMIPYPITIIFGKPMPASSTSDDVKRAILELSCAYFEDHKTQRRSLAEKFVEQARASWDSTAVADSSGKKLTYGKLLTASIALGNILEDTLKGQRYLGILLPPSVGGALANTAAALLNKTTVNLNYTLSREAIQSCIQQCDMRYVLTSRQFLEKLGLELDSCLYIEDLVAAFTPGLKIHSWLKACFLPKRILGHRTSFNADDVATVIFTSGSTGEPKGVQLSHHNIISNIESMRMLVYPRPDDCVCGILPFFHSFGYTTTLWFPLLSGYPAVYHYNPLDGEKIGELVRTYKATQLFTAPGFLMMYIRRTPAEDLRTLKLVVVGAEKLKKRLSDMFYEKFGMRPLEGYGATELSPVAALNIPDVEIAGYSQMGTKEGTVGQPLPGVAAVIIDPETGQPLAREEQGLLLIKGPNVMRGYLNRPDETARVMRDGWYVTGDIAMIDQDGFITITDRLSRFSKIGGEMVPHIAIEDILHESINAQDKVLAVTSVPDEKRGEKLVVLYTEAAGDAENLKRILAYSTIPNLWKPASDAYIKIDELPMLGSGKLDLKKLKEIAREALENKR